MDMIPCGQPEFNEWEWEEQQNVETRRRAVLNQAFQNSDDARVASIIRKHNYLNRTFLDMWFAETNPRKIHTFAHVFIYKPGWSADYLKEAIDYDKPVHLRELLRAGATITETYCSSSTGEEMDVLTYAIEKRKHDLAKIILEEKPILAKSDDSSILEYAMMTAADEELVTVLLAAGADILGKVRDRNVYRLIINSWPNLRDRALTLLISQLEVLSRKYPTPRFRKEPDNNWFIPQLARYGDYFGRYERENFYLCGFPLNTIDEEGNTFIQVLMRNVRSQPKLAEYLVLPGLDFTMRYGDDRGIMDDIVYLPDWARNYLQKKARERGEYPIEHAMLYRVRDGNRDDLRQFAYAQQEDSEDEESYFNVNHRFTNELWVKEEFTMLSVAVYNGFTSVVSHLLAIGADPNAPALRLGPSDKNARTVIHSAIQKGFTDISRLLLNSGASEAVIDEPWNILYQAIHYYDYDLALRFAKNMRLPGFQPVHPRRLSTRNRRN